MTSFNWRIHDLKVRSTPHEVKHQFPLYTQQYKERDRIERCGRKKRRRVWVVSAILYFMKVNSVIKKLSVSRYQVELPNTGSWKHIARLPSLQEFMHAYTLTAPRGKKEIWTVSNKCW